MGNNCVYLLSDFKLRTYQCDRCACLNCVKQSITKFEAMQKRDARNFASSECMSCGEIGLCDLCECEDPELVEA